MCRDDDVIEVIRSALREGRAIKTRQELVNRLKERCGYRNISSAYKLIKKLEERGVLRFVSTYGYMDTVAGHDRLIMQTLALILDMAHARDFSAASLERLVNKSYREEMPIPVARRLMAEAILHVATRSGDLAEELKKIARLLDRYDKLFKEWRLNMAELMKMRTMWEECYMHKAAKEVIAVLELGQGADANHYYKRVEDLMGRIARESDVRVACYREAERFEDREILKRLCDKIDKLDMIAPGLSHTLKEEKLSSETFKKETALRKIIGELGGLFGKMLDAITSFYIDAKATGRLAGWCRLCGGRIDNELVQSIEKMIGWLEKRAPKELSILLDKEGFENFSTQFVTQLLEKISKSQEKNGVLC
jgi:hypothetical protein